MEKTFSLPQINNTKTILALGPESDGNFCICKKNNIKYYYNLGDLVENENFNKFKELILEIVNNEKIDIIITDLHPNYNPSILGQELARTHNLLSVKIQHHVAHIYATVFSQFILNNKNVPCSFSGVSCDGTGLGEDNKIWGGEVFRFNNKIEYERIGSLEEQTLSGGDLSVNMPARMLISFLSKIFNNPAEIFTYVKNYYSENQTKVIYNQIKQGFNCVETTSTGRVIDSVSLLLGLCSNTRNYKHEPVDLLIKNSGTPYELKPKIYYNENKKRWILSTTYLFEYLIENFNKDKARLAATTQVYLAQGLLEIAKKTRNNVILFSGGMANNPLMAETMKKQNVIISDNIPSGDKGLSLGQLMYYLSLATP